MQVCVFDIILYVVKYGWIASMDFFSSVIGIFLIS